MYIWNVKFKKKYGFFLGLKVSLVILLLISFPFAILRIIFWLKIYSTEILENILPKDFIVCSYVCVTMNFFCFGLRPGFHYVALAALEFAIKTKLEHRDIPHPSSAFLVLS